MAVIESPSKSAVQAEVDPIFAAMRVTLRPLDYTSIQGTMGGKVGGHYRAFAYTSAIAPSANVVLANLRATDPGLLIVVTRVSVVVTVATAVTAQRNDPIGMFIARNYTVEETTNATAATLTGLNARLRSTIMSGPTATVRTTSNAAGMTGGTKTVDSNAVGLAGPNQALVGLGTGWPAQDIFQNEANGAHPIVLQQSEGLVMQWGATTLATGTVVVGVGFCWAEVPAF